jgi:tRNA(adenine34) deaminase
VQREKDSETSDQIARDQRWMRRALELAETAASLGEVPVGAVVVRNEEVIGEGWNQPISSNDPCAHAEVIALRDAASRIENYRLVDSTLYVTIEPCTMCAGALIHARIARLVYGATEPKSGVVHSNDCLLEKDYLNHKIDVSAGLMAEQSSQLISAFFRRRRAEKKQIDLT